MERLQKVRMKEGERQAKNKCKTSQKCIAPKHRPDCKEKNVVGKLDPKWKKNPNAHYVGSYGLGLESLTLFFIFLFSRALQVDGFAIQFWPVPQLTKFEPEQNRVKNNFDYGLIMNGGSGSDFKPTVSRFLFLFIL